MSNMMKASRNTFRFDNHDYIDNCESQDFLNLIKMFISEYRFNFHSRYISRHFVVAAAFLYVLQLCPLDGFVWFLSFGNDTHDSILLHYRRNIVQIN